MQWEGTHFVLFWVLGELMWIIAVLEVIIDRGWQGGRSTVVSFEGRGGEGGIKDCAAGRFEGKMLNLK